MSHGSSRRPVWHPRTAALAIGILFGVPEGNCIETPGLEEDTEAPIDLEEEDALRQRLTEREDVRQPPDPWSINVAERPLTITGEYEVALAAIRRRVIEEDVHEADRLLLAHELELEAFYTFGPALSMFAQMRFGGAEDQLDDTPDAVSESYVERGEMWLYSEDLGGSGIDLDLGRLHFEDERRWWWDDELDAIRISTEPEPLGFGLAVAQELGPERSSPDEIDPEDEDVLRVIGQLAWVWSPRHAMELFLLRQEDRSAAEQPGQTVRSDGADEVDADLTWWGARFSGINPLSRGGYWGYWFDSAWVRGRERIAEIDESESGATEVASLRERHVDGWALDAGFIGILPYRYEPRLYAGYAIGSGDADSQSSHDDTFRQTGLQSNEAGFGGVERFPSYGVLLDPELSNLRVTTVGAGFSLWRSSSLDLLYHHYQLVHPAQSLRDAGLDLQLDGHHRDLGEELDVVLAIEEWERLELLIIGSAFRAGKALGLDEGEWSLGGFGELRIVF